MSASLGAIEVDDCLGTLEINGISFMEEPWIYCWDPSELWFGPEFKGTPLVEQADADGGWAYPQFDKATTYPLPLLISGYYDAVTKARNANPYAGFKKNLKFLRDNVFNMEDTGVKVASWPAILTAPGESPQTRSVKVSRLVPGKHVGGLWSCSFQLTVVEGAFA